MGITLYTTHCPKCKVIEKKLTDKGIEFSIVDDEEKIMEIADKANIHSAPLLDNGDEILDFSSSINWINNKEK